MSDTTTIEWATASWSPLEGCTKVSAGCANCYAETRNHRFGMDNWGKGKPRRRTSAAYWKKPLAWNRQASMEFVCGVCHRRGTGEVCMGCGYGACLKSRPRIFPSLCDWLDDEVPIEWLADFLRLIHDTPNLDWLLLTKRPENWLPRMQSVIGRSCVTGCEREDPHGLAGWLANRWINGFAPANVWLGASVENQRCAGERIPQLLRIPAKLRFLSVEPMLEEVDLVRSSAIWSDMNGKIRPNYQQPGRHVDWVIVGGESGPGARPCNVEWVRGIVRQCQDAAVPCFVKQLGSEARVIACSECGEIGCDCRGATRTTHLLLKHPKGGDPAEWTADLQVRQFPQ